MNTRHTDGHVSQCLLLPQRSESIQKPTRRHTGTSFRRCHAWIVLLEIPGFLELSQTLLSVERKRLMGVGGIGHAVMVYGAEEPSMVGSVYRLEAFLEVRPQEPATRGAHTI